MGALLLLPVGLAMPAAAAAEPTPDDFRADARSIEALINANYAYLDRFPGEVAPIGSTLRAQAERVTDRRSLVRYAERVLSTLADHHAITGASLADSWAVVPSYADLWIEKRGDDYMIEAVRDASPAADAGVRVGDKLMAVDGVPIAAAARVPRRHRGCADRRTDVVRRARARRRPTRSSTQDHRANSDVVATECATGLPVRARTGATIAADHDQRPCGRPHQVP